MLYITATPIGNLEDITLRALRILKEVDFIACETVSHTQKLLNHYDIKTKCISYRDENRVRQTDFIISLLEEGKNVALVTDAGMPLISDPGNYLTEKLTEKGIEFTVIPGASASVSAFAFSGFCCKEFTFFGFLPSKQSKRYAIYDRIRNSEEASVIYEAPHRIEKTLKELIEVIPERKIALCHEMTKKFEKIYRGKAEEILKELGQKIQGEFVLVIDSAGQNELLSAVSVNEDLLNNKIAELFCQGKTSKDILKELKREYPKVKDLYSKILDLKPQD